jgi:hypothetical protein
MVAATRELSASGYTLEVDGRFKAEFTTRNGARAGGEELKKRFPMLQIRIYDAQTNAREEIEVFRFKPRRTSSACARAAPPHRALVNRAALRSAIRLRSLAQGLRSSSPGTLGNGARRHEACRRRYHCPVPGCPLNRSRRCTRSRVPPSASLCSRSCGRHFPLRRCALGARLIGAYGP